MSSPGISPNNFVISGILPEEDFFSDIFLTHKKLLPIVTLFQVRLLFILYWGYKP